MVTYNRSKDTTTDRHTTTRTLKTESLNSLPNDGAIMAQNSKNQ